MRFLQALIPQFKSSWKETVRHWYHLAFTSELNGALNFSLKGLFILMGHVKLFSMDVFSILINIDKDGLIISLTLMNLSLMWGSVQ